MTRSDSTHSVGKNQEDGESLTFVHTWNFLADDDENEEGKQQRLAPLDRVSEVTFDFSSI